MEGIALQTTEVTVQDQQDPVCKGHGCSLLGCSLLLLLVLYLDISNYFTLKVLKSNCILLLPKLCGTTYTLLPIPFLRATFHLLAIDPSLTKQQNPRDPPPRYHFSPSSLLPAGTNLTSIFFCLGFTMTS